MKNELLVANNETTATETTAKTCGVFKVTSSKNPDFSYIGASTQIEVAFRDYMKWTEKGKAPKAIQEEINANNGDKTIFSYNILEVTENDKAVLKDRKKFHMSHAAEVLPTPTPEEIEVLVQESQERLSVADRNQQIAGQLLRHISVDEIAKTFGVSKSTVYNVRRAL